MPDTPPLTPAGIDLSALEYMPLHVVRLRKSVAWVKAKRQPEIGFYMINLWTAAWHDVPAGSLPDDEDALADAAMCEPRRWAKVRDAAMRGFVLCSDGRWYHPFVCREVHTALARREKWRRQKRGQREDGGTDPPDCPPGQGGGQQAESTESPPVMGRDGMRRDHVNNSVPSPVLRANGLKIFGRGGVRRLKPAGKADQDMAAHLQVKCGMSSVDAWRVVDEARHPDKPGHAESLALCRDQSIRHKLGWFPEGWAA